MSPCILRYGWLLIGVFLWNFGGCFQPQDNPSEVKGTIPKGFTARFEGVSYRQIRFDEQRWLEGKAKALNANPLKLKFDLEETAGTVWLSNGETFRDFDINFLELRGEKKQTRLTKGGVVGLGTHQWLRLKRAVIHEDNLTLNTDDTAWVVSPNMWLTSPQGLQADLPKAEVVTKGPVRMEAFEMKN